MKYRLLIFQKVLFFDSSWNSISSENKTPLIWAITRGQQFFDILIKHGIVYVDLATISIWNPHL